MEQFHNGINWAKYNENKAEKPPNNMLIEAIEHVSGREAALDFGAGALVDSQFLLDQGFSQVIAIDADPDSERRASEIKNDALEFKRQTFEDTEVEAEYFDIINAQWVIPYVAHGAFASIVKNILNGLKDGGVISINFFGDKDDWNTDDTLKNFVTKEQVTEIFQDFEIIEFEEIEDDKGSVLGKLHHRHVFNIIARRILSTTN